MEKIAFSVYFQCIYTFHASSWLTQLPDSECQTTGNQQEVTVPVKQLKTFYTSVQFKQTTQFSTRKQINLRNSKNAELFLSVKAVAQNDKIKPTPKGAPSGHAFIHYISSVFP